MKKKNMHIKKHAALSMLIVITTMFASVRSEERFALGLKTGLNLSTLRGDNITSVEQRVISIGGPLKSRMYSSYGGGLFLRWEFKDDFLAFQTEVMYNRTGKLWRSNSGDVTLSTNYLSVPLTVMVMMPMDVLKPYLSAGIVGMYAMHSTAENVGTILPQSDTFISSFTRSDVTGQVSRMDMGLVAGVGCDIAVSAGAFILDIRYQMGVFDVYEVEGGDKIKNSSLSVSTGYTLYF